MMPRKVTQPHRCRANHSVMRWPYVARCVKDVNHDDPYEHIDDNDDKWHQEPCDGCKYIERVRDDLDPDDGLAYEQLRRLEREHLRECPNGRQ